MATHLPQETSDRLPVIPGSDPVSDVPLLRCHRRYWLYPANLAAASVELEAHMAVHEREKRVVATNSNAGARVELRATLAHDNVASDDGFTTVALHAEIFWV